MLESKLQASNLFTDEQQNNSKPKKKKTQDK